MSDIRVLKYPYIYIYICVIYTYIYISIYNIHIYIYHPYICHIYTHHIYEFTAANVRCLFFLAELSGKNLPRFPEVSLSCSSWDVKNSQAEKKPHVWWELYTVYIYYIYNVVESIKTQYIIYLWWNSIYIYT